MSGTKLIHHNKRAGYDFYLSDRMEAGLVLVGTEVKSLRQGKVNLSEAFVTISQGEAWLYQMQIAVYSHGNQFNHEEFRKRKLLLSKEQIAHLELKMNKEGLHLLPISLYFKKSLVKVEIALGKAKKLHDKRQSIRDKEIKRDLRSGNY